MPILLLAPNHRPARNQVALPTFAHTVTGSFWPIVHCRRGVESRFRHICSSDLVAQFVERA